MSKTPSFNTASDSVTSINQAADYLGISQQRFKALQNNINASTGKKAQTHLYIENVALDRINDKLNLVIDSIGERLQKILTMDAQYDVTPEVAQAYLGVVNFRFMRVDRHLRFKTSFGQKLYAWPEVQRWKNQIDAAMSQVDMSIY